MDHRQLPHRWLTWTELPRTIFAMATLPLHWRHLAFAQKGDGRPIIVIPGFGMTDRSTFVLRQYLRFLGYTVYGWELGRNLGAKTIGLRNERLIARVSLIYATECQPLTLIGWSMGGIMARMIARHAPQQICEVISLAAPFTGDPFANTSWKVYERMSGHSLSHPVAQAQIAESKLPLPVRACSFYSKSDGVVAWQGCLEPNQRLARNIEVRSAHCGFGFSGSVLRAIADRLAETAQHATRQQVTRHMASSAR
jgi:pimeloyl-ACP methyl ester carboxylesterase